MFLFVCLRFFVKNFHSYGDVTITSEGLQLQPILGTHCHLAMSSLACHTYCDTGHPSIWSSSSTVETHTCCQAFSTGAITFCFYDLGLSQIPTPNLPHARRTLQFTGSDINAVCHAVSKEKQNIDKLKHLFLCKISTQKWIPFFVGLFTFLFTFLIYFHFWRITRNISFITFQNNIISLVDKTPPL